MTQVTATLVKSLRDKTGAGMMACKKALSETGGDVDKAVDYLREKGVADAGKRAGRQTSEGVVFSYIHPGSKIGVIVEVNCETDFVARNSDFQAFVKDVSMHIAASNPLYLGREGVPQELVDKEREIFLAQAKESGKPEKILDKIVDGRLDKYFQQVCLLEQPFVKDPDKKVEDHLKAAISTIGENIQIRRFARYQLGEELPGAGD